MQRVVDDKPLANMDDIAGFCDLTLEFFRDLPEPVLSDQLLTKFSIRRGAPLNIDIGDEDEDDEPLFFRPYPDCEEIGVSVTNAHPEEDWSFCDRDHHEYSCSSHMIDRFSNLWTYSMLTYEYKHTRDWYWLTRPCENLEHLHIMGGGSRDHPNEGHREYPEWYTFDMFEAEHKPHIGCVISETTVPKGDEVLRSEVVSVAYLVKHRLDHGLFPNHNIPMLVFSFGHNSKVRITQFHFDKQGLVFRQARLLNVGSESIYDVAEDFFVILRWMKCEPIGETELGTASIKDKVAMVEDHSVVHAAGVPRVVIDVCH